MDKMPKWADVILIPLISVLLALIVSGLVVLIIGENPIEAMQIMVRGAFGSAYGWGYTLYYATNFIFTGLAVAVAFHARLFNIGGARGRQHSAASASPSCFSARLAALDHRRFWRRFSAPRFSARHGLRCPPIFRPNAAATSLITTIMFNFIASALLVYLLVNVFRVPGSMAPESAPLRRGRCTCPAPPNSRAFWALAAPPAQLRLLRRAGLLRPRLDSDLAHAAGATRSGPLAIPKRRRSMPASTRPGSS